MATEVRFYSVADGFYPAGAAVDVRRGVQHIFMYSDDPNGPTGVFCITRTLDTTQPSAALGNRQP